MSFLDKSWQLCWIIWSLSVNAIQDTKVLYMQRKQAAPCHLLPLESLLLNVIYNLFMHSAKYVKKGEKNITKPSADNVPNPRLVIALLHLPSINI